MGKLPENFAGYPVSTREAKAEKTRNSKHWTPRDVLLSLLRDLDSGAEHADDLVVAFRRVHEDGSTLTRFRVAARDHHVAMGLFAVGAHMIREDR